MYRPDRRGIYIPNGKNPWPHEMRVAKILSAAGHYVEFIEETKLQTADIRLDGTEFEIKSPRSFNANSFEHTLKRGIRQSPNLIIDSSRMKGVRDDKIRVFLVNQARKQKQIKKLLFITKRGQIVDISAFI